MMNNLFVCIIMIKRAVFEVNKSFYIPKESVVM